MQYFNNFLNHGLTSVFEMCGLLELIHLMARNRLPLY